MRLSSEQEDLRAAVRSLIGRTAAAGKPAADPAAQHLWQRLCGEIGVAGLLIPERYGGAGAGPVEVAVVMEELGRAVAPAPMLGSAVLATSALLACGDQAARDRLLPGLASGSQLAALAWTTAAGHWDPAEVACTAARPAGRDGAGPSPSGDGPAASASRDDSGWLISGEARYVLDGDQASVLLVPARMAAGDVSLFEVGPAQPEVIRHVCTTVDQTRGLATVRLTGAAGRRIGGPVRLAAVRDAACVALAAEQAGAAAGALAQTVAYAKARVQFGVPIGSFQALQHRMAEMHVLAESARSLAYAAAAAAAAEAGGAGAPGAGRDQPELALRAAAAKAYCSEALQQVSAEMIQLHGAIGMTWEHDAHRYFKRAASAAMLFGPPARHVDRIAAAVVDR